MNSEKLKLLFPRTCKKIAKEGVDDFLTECLHIKIKSNIIFFDSDGTSYLVNIKFIKNE